ncbi:DinB family protein [Ramlibacter alkalitolerans]|jgi:uncharacterized damage-inducible protein DinB|uniref:DinB family protein n=1 Tax=Ramlibacter alkalitolerans TaxID=2039631 RepID=A0ABS1JNL8_9BURK|nr:DinB family protein [Ramlibacter alkalitolerans]MBL0425860.1 DinB family protein [Ramlibacter alkalitolerans]
MSATAQIRRLTRYNAWANARLFQAVSELPEGAATAARPTLFGNMVHTLNHSFVVDRIWQAHLEGRPHGYTALNTKETPGFAELRQAQAEMDQWYVKYADTLPQDAHDEAVAFRFVDGGAGTMSRADILLHVVNHKTYHRGWVADMFFQAGVRPPATDLPVFLREAG